MTWTPPPRPAWVERLIGHGDAAGGAQNLVSLDAIELQAAAQASTRLEDFGPATWVQHYETLLHSIHDESRLHLVGRIMTRTEVLRSLRTRLLLARLWDEQPGVLERPIVEPVFVIGLARSGTSILHELLALDTRSRAPATWELLHPAEAASADPETRAAARQAGDDTHSFWQEVQPEYDAMHHNDGDLPNECIFALAHEFLSDHWSGVHATPSYAAHVAFADHIDAYRYHRRILQTLQGDEPARWVLKAPSHLAQLPTLFAVYPDARVVHIHRDPLKTVPSTLSLLGALKSMRCEGVSVDDLPPVAQGSAMLLDNAISARADGSLPDDQFVDVRYAALLAAPATTVVDVYERLGWPAADDLGDRVNRYVDAKPKGAHGTHAYSLEDFGLDAATERQRHREYCDRFDVPEEA